MLGTHPLIAPLSGVLNRLRDWPISAQQQARRNAMVAATACAQRRIEREEVADYLRTRTQPTASASTPGPSTGAVRAHA